jgi:Holliday junction resolvase
MKMPVLRWIAGQWPRTMRYEILCVAKKIVDIHGSGKVYGKIFEKLLGISFGPKRGGFSVVNNSTQGVDLELIQGAKKFAIEVKTTASANQILLADKDLRDGVLRKATNEGYVPAIACLRLDFLEEWRICKAHNLKPRMHSVSSFSINRIQELEAIANLWFPRTLLELKDQILDQRNGETVLNFLSERLRAEHL